MTDESPLLKAQADFSGQIHYRSLSSETCHIGDAANRICYSPVTASMDSPPYARAIVEGFLVNTDETKAASEATEVSFKICGEILPGDEKILAPQAGEAVKISTGSMIPEGDYSAIRPWEAKITDGIVSISRPFPPRFFIEEQGCEIEKGSELVSAGTMITPEHIGALASMGIDEISVIQKTRVTIFTSGDEVIPHTEKFIPGSIFDCNSPMLAAAVKNAGGTVTLGGIQADNFDGFVGAAKKALADSDMLLISGGTAIDGRDFISDLVSELGELIIDGVKMRSGRPLIMGIAQGKPIICVAGYPPEALRGFTLFGQPAMDILSGHSKE